MAFLCFETAIKKNGSELLPLTEKIINDSLRPLGKVIPSGLFILWCKKCWQFLNCSKVAKKTEEKKPAISAAS